MQIELTPFQQELARQCPCEHGTSREQCQLELQVALQLEEGRNKKVVKVALNTLRDVDFGPYMLLHFTQELLAEYACSEDACIRKAAAVAAWRVTVRQWALLR
jgi:hypothetical protein